jgi:putative tryptophan/tyrosine transport system substrate-binding protein
MRRREFITLLGGAAAWMSPARAQEPRRVIGVLGSASFSSFPGAEAAFIQGLKNSGFIEGKNINMSSAGVRVNTTACHRSRANWWPAMCL